MDSPWSDGDTRIKLIVQGIDALRCRQPEHDAHETYANTL